MNIKSIRSKDGSLVSYYILVVLRVVLVFVPQLGYIHPDEFFQSVEVMAGDEFGLEVTTTWEFNTTFPIRSIAIPYFGLKVPFNFMRFLSMYTKFYLGVDLRSSYFLLTFPRLMMCLLSFVNDWSLFKICQSYGLKFQFRLLVLASSYIMLVYSTRTFSNTVEMALCSVLLYVVSDCMIHSNTVIYQREFLEEKYKSAQKTIEKVKLYKLKTALPRHSFNKCAVVSTLCVIGFFNRPTFLLFGLPLVFHWMLRGMGTKTVSFLDFNLRIATFLISSIPSISFFVIVDSLYYGYLTLPEIEKLEVGINSFVMTPLNFVKYNINPENTKEHGVHSHYLHLMVNLPILYNILGVIGLFSFGNMMYRFGAKEYTYLPRAQSFVGLMLSAIFFPIFALSLINHQEPRFLIPVTLPLVLLHAPKLKTGFCPSYPFKTRSYMREFVYKYFLQSKVSSKYLLHIWYSVNFALTIFFGFVHQGGVYQVGEYFSRLMQVKSNSLQVHLVTSHMYSMPQSFVMLPSTKVLHVNPATGQKYRRLKQFFTYEYGSMDLNILYKKLKLLLDMSEMKSVSNNQKYQLYLAIPSSLSENLNQVFYNSSNSIIKHKIVKTFYPHLSTEAMPKLFGQHLCGINTDVDEIDQTCSIYEFDDIQNPYSVSSLLRKFSSLIHQFGIILYRIEVRKKLK